MSQGLYNKFKYNLMKKLIDLSSDTITVALMTNSHAFNADNNVWADVSANEITGTGYSTPGANLTGLTVTQDDGNNKAVFGADNASWGPSATFDAYHAVVYDNTISGDPLIGSFDFGGIKSVVSGTFTINWSSGIVDLS